MKIFLLNSGFDYNHLKFLENLHKITTENKSLKINLKLYILNVIMTLSQVSDFWANLRNTYRLTGRKFS